MITIVLADDEKLIRAGLKKILTEALAIPIEILEAKNGQEAVDLVTASLPGYYSAVLMDIQMPVMDGYEATKQIRQIPDEALSSIPIIAMTANAFSEDVKKAKEAGMNEHIAKPIDLNMVLKVLREVMGGKEF